MKLDIYRSAYGANSTPGQLFVDGQAECYTLEPSKDHPFFEGHPCIPAGLYEIKLTPSPHMGYVTPEVLNVPGRTDIRIHIANYPKELKGCTAVGEVARTDMVLNSKTAFERLMTLLRVAAASGEALSGEWHEPPVVNSLPNSQGSESPTSAS